MGISHVRVMEPILEKLAIAIRTSQFTDAHQNSDFVNWTCGTRPRNCNCDLSLCEAQS